MGGGGELGAVAARGFVGRSAPPRANCSARAAATRPANGPWPSVSPGLLASRSRTATGCSTASERRHHRRHRHGPAPLPRRRRNAQDRQEVSANRRSRAQVPVCSTVGRPASTAAGITMYAHGIATIALCEAYGMTKDRNMLLRPAPGRDQLIAAKQAPTAAGATRRFPRRHLDRRLAGSGAEGGNSGGLVVPDA